MQQTDDTYGKDLAPGASHYRAYIGPPQRYDLMSATQFNLLTSLGLREDHRLLDIGCGSLRGGKLFIPYLLPEHYYGIEPEQWLIDEGVKNEIGEDLLRIKRPTLSNDRDFSLSTFNQQFDFILAQSIFSHTSQAQIRRCLSEATKVMKPTTLFVASYLRGDNDYTGDEWFYPGAIPYTFERLSQLAAEQGLVCKSLVWPHPNDQSWIVIIHPEHEQHLTGWNEQLPQLREELNRCKQQLAKVQNHPYVRIGLQVNKLFRRVKN